MPQASETGLPAHEPEGSGAQDMVGYHVTLDDPDGSAVVRLAIEDRHLNRNGTLHGGIHAMMLDAAAGFAASRWFSGAQQQLVPVVTLSLTTSFVAAVAQGEVVVTGWVTGGGHKTVFGAAETRDARGRVISTASGVFKRASS